MGPRKQTKLKSQGETDSESNMKSTNDNTNNQNYETTLNSIDQK